MKKIVKILALMLATLSIGSCFVGCNSSGDLGSSSDTSNTPSGDTLLQSPIIHPEQTVYVDAVKSKDYTAHYA